MTKYFRIYVSKKRERKKRSFLSSLGRLPLPTAHPAPLPLAAQAAPRPRLLLRRAPLLTGRPHVSAGRVVPNLPPASRGGAPLPSIRAPARLPMMVVAYKGPARESAPPGTLAKPRRHASPSRELLPPPPLGGGPCRLLTVLKY